MRIAFIGFGEASFNIAKGLLSEDANIELIAYDINSLAIKKAHDLGIAFSSNIENILITKCVAIVAVPGKDDLALFQSIRTFVKPNSVFIDISSALPNDKRAINNLVKTKSSVYIDVAVLGSVPKLLHKTPMLISGDDCSKMIEIASSFNMNVRVCGKEAGIASTIKLCRSIFMKGLPALLKETIDTSKKYGVNNEVLESIYDNLKDQSFDSFLNRLLDGAIRHAVRQKDEIEECIDIQKQVGIEPIMTSAAYKIFKKFESNE